MREEVNVCINRIWNAGVSHSQDVYSPVNDGNTGVQHKAAATVVLPFHSRDGNE